MRTSPDAPDPRAEPVAPPAVELNNLHKSFRTRSGRVAAVDGLDLTIAQGEIVALLGPNGAGKTTALDMVLGFTDPTSGTCRVLGLPPRQAVNQGRVSAVLQSGALLDDLTVRETVAMVATQHPRHLPIDEALERAGASGIARRKVSKCSGGEQQRLRFALALLCEPELLVLDEPTAGMDVTVRRDFWASMHQEAQRGRTIIFATHYLEEAEQFADRIVVVSAGRIIADGTTEQIRAMGGLRRVTCRWDPVDGDPASVLSRLPEGVQIEQTPERTVFSGADTDLIARTLLTTTRASDLLIVQAGLEEAFVGLTSTTADDDAA